MLKTIGILYPQTLLETIASTEFASFVRENGCDTFCFGSVDEFHKAEKIVDIIISFDMRVPNVFDVPTFLAFASSPRLFVPEKVLIRNILTYDGYLTDTSNVREVLEDLLFSARKTGTSVYNFSQFFREIDGWSKAAKLPTQIITCLFNLSEKSYPSSAVKALAKRKVVTVCYPSFQIKKKLRGNFVPLTTVDFLSTEKSIFYGQLYWLTDSVQSFEDALTIEMKWALSRGLTLIASWSESLFSIFGDSIIYIQPGLKKKQLARELRRIKAWASDHPEDCQKKSKRSQQIYSETFTPDEASFSRLKNFFIDIAKKKRYPVFNGWRTKSSFSFIIRTGGKADNLERALDSIVAQDQPNVTVIFVLYKPLQNLETRIKPYNGKLKFKIIEDFGNLRSTGIVLGMANVESDYFGLLDDDDTIHPNHIGILISCLEKAQKTDPKIDQRLVYSGNYVISDTKRFGEAVEWSSAYGAVETSHRVIENFRFYEPKLMSQHLWYMGSNSWLAHKSLINEELLRDTKTHSHEDIYFELQFAMQTRFVFSVEVTAAHWFDGQNSTIMDIYRNDSDVFRHTFSLTYRKIGDYTYRHGNHSEPFSVSGAFPPKIADTPRPPYRNRYSIGTIHASSVHYWRLGTRLARTNPKRLIIMAGKWIYRKLI